METFISKDLINKIKKHLTPDLLKGVEYDPKNPLKGHCYVASEALYYFLDKSLFCPVVASYKSSTGKKCTHWWIANRSGTSIFDLTGEQFKPSFLKQLYTKGRKSGFLTKKPSKRAKILIHRVLND